MNPTEHDFQLEIPDNQKIKYLFLEILHEYLEEPACTQTRIETAQEVHYLYISAQSDDGAIEGLHQTSDEFLWWFWDILLQVAESIIPYDAEAQESLAQLITTLRNLPFEVSISIRGSRCKLWQDLPLLDHNIAEKMNAPTQSQQHWQNLNGFAARLTRDGIYKGEL